MNPDLVLQKTEKGREEIEKRTFRVDARRRTMLILVDGRSTAGALAEKSAHLTDPLGMLQSLWTEGFIEPAGALAGAPSREAPAEPRTGGRPLDELKRIACGQIEKLMGPDGDSVALKIERAATLDDFFVEARKAREVLKAFLGPRQAEAFWKSIES